MSNLMKMIKCFSYWKSVNFDGLLLKIIKHINKSKCLLNFHHVTSSEPIGTRAYNSFLASLLSPPHIELSRYFCSENLTEQMFKSGGLPCTALWTNAGVEDYCAQHTASKRTLSVPDPLLANFSISLKEVQLDRNMLPVHSVCQVMCGPWQMGALGHSLNLVSSPGRRNENLLSATGLSHSTDLGRTGFIFAYISRQQSFTKRNQGRNSNRAGT